jgi:hypothetical protein
MSYNNGSRAFTAGEALLEKRRVKIKSGTTTTPPEVEYADAGEQHIGITAADAAISTIVTVNLRTLQGSVEGVASEAFAVGATLYGAADGKIADTSSGAAIGIAIEAATADLDVVEWVQFIVVGNTGAGTSLADSGGFTAQTTVEAAIAEIYQNMFSVQAFFAVPLTSLREATAFDVGNIAANGGLLASDTTPVLSAINDATDGCQRVLWAASNMDQVIFQMPLPPDFDDTADLVLHIRAAMAGATDTPTIAVDSFFNEGDTKVVDATGAVTGASYAEYTATIANADIPVSSQSLTIGLTPGAHTTDTLAVSAIWLEYKRKLLTA